MCNYLRHIERQQDTGAHAIWFRTCQPLWNIHPCMRSCRWCPCIHHDRTGSEQCVKLKILDMDIFAPPSPSDLAMVYCKGYKSTVKRCIRSFCFAKSFINCRTLDGQKYWYCICKLNSKQREDPLFQKTWPPSYIVSPRPTQKLSLVGIELNARCVFGSFIVIDYIDVSLQHKNTIQL